MSHHPCSLFGRTMRAVGAAAAGLVLSVVASPFAAADDPVGSPTPSQTATVAASPTPTASPDPSVTPTGSESPSPSPVATTPDVTASPTPEASVAPGPAEQQSPSPAGRQSTSRRVGNAQVTAVTTTTSGFLRDATTGAPIRNSCLAWRSTSVTATATNATINVNEQGRWSFDSNDPGPFYISFYVTDNGDCSHPVLTGPDNYRASWYQGQPFTGTDPDTALPPPAADQVTAGSNITACLGKQNALPTECATPDATVSGRVVGFGPVPIFQACIVALGPDGNVSNVAVSDANGRWTLTGLPINYNFVIAVLPPIQTSRGPCQLDGPPPAPPPGALQPEFYDDTWADLSDQNLLQNPFGWATDPNSPHPAVTLRNSRTGIDVCLTTETGRNTERGSCDPGTPTPTPTPTATVTPSVTGTPSTQPVLAATGGPSRLTVALGAALLLGAVGLLTQCRSISRRSRSTSEL